MFVLRIRGCLPAITRRWVTYQEPKAWPQAAPEELLERKSAFGDQMVERLSFDELHGQEVDAVGLLHQEHADDAGVVERRERTGLALEAFEPLGIRGHFRRQDLERHVAPSFVSVARKTSPMPPAPMAAVMR